MVRATIAAKVVNFVSMTLESKKRCRFVGCDLCVMDTLCVVGMTT